MEPVGLAVGLAGLAGIFNNCVDVVARIRKYKNFDTDAEILDTRFEAARVQFEQWGPRVGLRDGKVLSQHHTALDSDHVRMVVQRLLTQIRSMYSLEDPQQLRRTNSLEPHFGVDGPAVGPRAPGPSKSRRLGWALGNKEERTDNIVNFERLVQCLHEVVPPENPAHTGPHMEQVSLRLDEIMDDLARANKVRFRKDVQAWLDSDALSKDIYIENRKKKLTGTCSWILERKEYLKWAYPASDSAPKTLWVNGPAGFGKTILCTGLVEHLSATIDAPVASFFITPNSASREDPYVALRAWISHIIERDEGAWECARLRWESEPDPVASQASIVALFGQIAATNKGNIFVIDGLDEFTSTSKGLTSMTSFLQTVIDTISGTNDRLLIVSRDLVSIRQALGDGGFVEYQISESDVRPDIEAFSKYVVDDKLANKVESERTMLSSVLSDRSQGQFLWVRLQQGHLRGALPSKQIKRRIENTPADLSSAYERDWTRILQLSDPAKKWTFSLLRWTACALRPLTVAEVTAAAVYEAGEDLEDYAEMLTEEYVATEIREYCGALLDVRQNEGEDSTTRSPPEWILRLPHFTVREYLLRTIPSSEYLTLRPIPTIDATNEERHHSMLAQTCLRYICVAGMWDELPPDSPRLWLRSYAARMWHRHFDQGCDKSSDMVMQIVVLLTSEHTQAWRALMAKDLLKNGSDLQKPPLGSIIIATQLGLLPAVETLVEKSGDCHLNWPDSQGGPRPLEVACAHGHAHIVQWLIEKGADTNVQGRSGWKPIHYAAGHVNILEQLLKSGAEINIADETVGWTPLLLSTAEGNTDSTLLLLKEGADPSAVTKDGWTPLMMAAEGGHDVIIRALLRAGADPYAKLSDNWTALAMVCHWDHVSCVRTFLENGTDPWAHADTLEKCHPVLIALIKSHREIVKLFLDHATSTSPQTDKELLLLAASFAGDKEKLTLALRRGANVNFASKVGKTPLELACAENHVELAHELIDLGAEINASRSDGFSPLLAAIHAGNLDVVKMLQVVGAKVNLAEANTEQRPMNWGANPDSVEVIRFLLDHGADINATAEGGDTALHCAARADHLETAQTLLQHGADVTVRDAIGQTPLHVAAMYGRTQVMAFLLRQEKTDPDQLDPFLRNALFYAARFGRQAAVQVLLDDGRSSTAAARDWQGLPLLFAAVVSGHVAIVRKLLEQGGCSLGRQEQLWLGQSPLYWAGRSGCKELVELLRGQLPSSEAGQGEEDDAAPTIHTMDCFTWCDCCMCNLSSAMYWYSCAECKRVAICKECHQDRQVGCSKTGHELRLEPNGA